MCNWIFRVILLAILGTMVTSKSVKPNDRKNTVNVVNKSIQESSFYIPLQNSSYVSGFTMEIGDVSYEGKVLEKNQAVSDFHEAIAQDRAAAYVRISETDPSQLAVTANVSPHLKPAFHFSFEDRSSRRVMRSHHDGEQQIHSLKDETPEESDDYLREKSAAYTTVLNLIKQGSSGNHSNYLEQALNISLQYQLVTSLTAMLAVQTQETATGMIDSPIVDIKAIAKVVSADPSDHVQNSTEDSETRQTRPVSQVPIRGMKFANKIGRFAS